MILKHSLEENFHHILIQPSAHNPLNSKKYLVLDLENKGKNAIRPISDMLRVASLVIWSEDEANILQT